ncbi:hypothetical protein WAI453_011966 [Rhynchosporium graminicola]
MSKYTVTQEAIPGDSKIMSSSSPAYTPDFENGLVERNLYGKLKHLATSHRLASLNSGAFSDLGGRWCT